MNGQIIFMPANPAFVVEAFNGFFHQAADDNLFPVASVKTGHQPGSPHAADKQRSIRMTLAPCRAAATAVLTPAEPPPQTSTSHLSTTGTVALTWFMISP
jgi:hypothetical protein